MTTGAALTGPELDFAITQTMRARTELIEKFGERAAHIFAVTTIFALGDTLEEQKDKALVVALVNKMLESRAPELRLVPIS